MTSRAHRFLTIPPTLSALTLLLLPVVLSAPASPAWAGDDEAGPQRQVVQRSPSSSSPSASSSGGRSAPSGRGGSSSASQGAGRTRPGGGGGDRGVATRPPGSGGGGGGRHGGHHGGHHGGYYGGHHGGYYYPSFRYYGHFGFGWYGYPYFGYYPYGYPYPPRIYYTAPVTASLGGLDLDIKPKKAEVYVDGHWAGRVGDFDGYPSYLWLEKGTHDLVIYRPGYETYHQKVEVRPGLVIRLKDRLVEGVATPPEEIVPPPPPPERHAGGSETGEEAGSSARSPAATEPGRLHLVVEPLDSSVYLDGRFLGTGDELAKLHAGLMVNPGEHRIAVVRPSYEAEELIVDVMAGQDLDLAVRLRPAS